MLDDDEKAMLVGYARKANDKYIVKLSINKSAFEDCEIYTTSDGQQYVSLAIGIRQIEKILSGELSVSTISQIIKKGSEQNE